MNPDLKPNALAKPVKQPKVRKSLRRSRKPIRTRTSKRANEEAKYRRRVKVWLSTKIFCKCPNCQNIATECHHRNGKRGRLLNYEPFWIPVCAACHYWIHFANPKKAQELGLLGNAGEWNNQSLVPEE